MILVLTIVTVLGISTILIASYLVYIIQSTRDACIDEDDCYNRDGIEELLNVMGVSYILFRSAYIICYALILGGIGMMVYKIMN